MYTLAVQKDFIASHFLIGGNWGEENSPHPHHYRVEVQVSGEALDEHGYLADIVKIQGLLEDQISRYRGRTLNGLPEFAGLNPSIELLATILSKGCVGHLRSWPGLTTVRVKVWENQIAWASYTEEIRNGRGGVSPPLQSAG